MKINRVLKDRFINLSLRTSSLLSKLIFLIVLGRSLTDADFGYYGLISSSIIYMCGFLGLEFYSYTNRLILNEKASANKLLLNHLLLIIVVFFTVTCILYITGLGSMLAGDYFLLFIMILFSEYISVELNRLLILKNMQVISSILLFIRTGFWMLPAALLIIINESKVELSQVLWFWVIMSGIPAMISGGLVIIKFDLKFQMANIDRYLVLEGLKQSFPLFIASQLTLLLFIVDRVYLKFVSGIEIVGVYIFFYGITNALMSILESTTFMYFWPKLVILFSNDKGHLIKVEVNKMLKNVLFTSILIAIISVLLIDYIIIFIDKDFVASYKTVFFILLLSFIFRSLSYTYHYALYSIKADSILFFISFFSIIVFFILSFLLVIFLPPIFAVSNAILVVSLFQLGCKKYFWDIKEGEL